MKLIVASTILASSVTTTIGSVRKNVGDNSVSTIGKSLSVSSTKKKSDSTVIKKLKEQRALKRENGNVINQLKNKLDRTSNSSMSRNPAKQSNEIDVGALGVSRNLQGNATESTVIGDLYDLCSSDATDPEFTCTCTNLNLTAYTASVSCAYAEKCLEPTENSCKENMTFCFVETYNLEVSAPGSGSSSICYDVTTPYSFSYCYGLTYSGDSETPSGCFLELDDTKCNSCVFSVSPIYPNVTCNDFDCNNIDTGVGTGQICGDDTIVSMKIEEYLTYAPLPCPGGCNICPGGGEMTNLDANVTMITGDSYYCYQLNLAAQLGYLEEIPGDLCSALPDIVAQPCGCEGGTTASPVAAPTMTVEETTEAPVSVTKDATTDAPVAPVPAPVPETVDPVPAPEPSAAYSSNYVLAIAAAVVTSFRLMMA